MAAGVYVITNIINGHSYVGSTINIEKRWRGHKNLLRQDKHPSFHLQNAWNKYGESSFSFVVLRNIDNSNDLLSNEQEYIDTIQPEYNIAPIAGNSLGIKRRPETIEKLVMSHKGKPSGKKGCKLSEETRAKISEVQKGHKASQETRAKMSASCKRLKQSDEHYAKLSALFTGKPLSEEHKKKLSIAHKGCQSARGHKVSDEVKARLSVAAKLQWQKIRENKLNASI